MTATTDTRRGIPAACQQHITTAETHVRILFLGKDGKTLCPALRADQSFMLRCLQDPTVSHWSAQMYRQAEAGNAHETYQAAKGWYKAVVAAMARLEAAMQHAEPLAEKGA